MSHIMTPSQISTSAASPLEECQPPQSHNQNLTPAESAPLEKQSGKRPRPEDFGYEECAGFGDHGPSGWQFEGGEDAYDAALKLWQSRSLKLRVINATLPQTRFIVDGINALSASDEDAQLFDLDGIIVASINKPSYLMALLGLCKIECKCDDARVTFILPEWMEVAR